MTQRTLTRLAVLVLVLAVVGGGLFVGGRYLNRVNALKQAESGIERGVELYESGRYAEALPHLSRYVAFHKTEPEHWRNVYRLAVARRNVPEPNQQHLVTAINQAQQAHNLKPDEPAPLILLIELYSERGVELLEMESATRKLAELLPPDDPRLMQAQQRSVSSLLQRGRIDDARVRAQQLIDANATDASNHRVMLDVMREASVSQDELIEYAATQYETQPDDPAFALLLVETLGLEDRPQDAVAVIQSLDADLLQAAQPDTLHDLYRLTGGVGIAALLQGSSEVRSTRSFSRGVLDRIREDGARSDDPARAAILANWFVKLGEPENAADSLSAVWSEELTTLPDQALGWAMILDRSEPDANVPGEAAALRAELDRRGTPHAAIWLDYARGLDLLEAGEPLPVRDHFDQALERARATLRTASRSLDADAAATRRTIEQLLPVFRHFLAQANERLGEFDVAADLWRSASAADAIWVTPAERRVALAQSREDYDEALRAATWAYMVDFSTQRAYLLASAYLDFRESGEPEVQTITPYAAAVTRELLLQVDALDRDVPPSWAELSIRNDIIAERYDRAAERFDELIAANETLPVDVAVRLHQSMRDTPLAPRSERLEGMLAPDSGADGTSRLAAALLLADRGADAEAIGMLESDLQNASTEAERVSARARLAELLDRIWPRAEQPQETRARAADLFLAVSEARPADVETQTRALDSSAVWNDPAAVTTLIDRLRDAAGRDSSAWRLYDSRRLLTFDADEDAASEQILRLGQIVRSRGGVGEGTLLDDTQIEALRLTAEWYLVLDEPAQAADRLATAVDGDARRADLYPPLIRLLRAVGRTDEADDRLDAFVTLEPLPAAMRRARIALLDERRAPGDLVRIMQDAAALADSDRPDDILLFAEVKLNEDSPGAARDAAAAVNERVLTQPELTQSQVFRAARLLGRAEGLEAALAVLAEYADDWPDEQRVLARSVLLEQFGSLAAALDLVRNAVEESASPELYGRLAELYVAAAQNAAGSAADASLQSAIDALDRGLELAPDNVSLRRSRALAILGRGSNEGVADALADLAEVTDDSREADALRGMADAYRQLGPQPDRPTPEQTLDFIAALRGVVTEHPRFQQGWLALVQAELRAAERGVRDIEGAARVTGEAFAALPSSPAVAALAIDAFAAAGRLDEAIVAAERWRRLSPGSTFEADLQLARLQLAAARPVAARNALDPWAERIVAMRPGGATLLLYARTLAATGDTDRADALLRDEVGAGPDEPAPQLLPVWSSIVTELAEQDNRNARQSFDALRRTAEPLQSDPEVGLGATWALAVAAASLTPPLVEEAERYYRLALDHSPELHPAMNNLAYLLLSHAPDRMEEAKSLATEAVRLAGEDETVGAAVLASYHDTLARTQLASGEVDAALETFQAGAELTERPLTELLLGQARALLRLERTDGVRDLLDAVAARDRDLTQKDRLRLTELRQTLNEFERDAEDTASDEVATQDAQAGRSD